MSYAILGYKAGGGRARVFISGFKDHVAIYPVPRNPALAAELAPWVRGKGTLWFPLNAPLPRELILRTIHELWSPTG